MAKDKNLVEIANLAVAKAAIELKQISKMMDELLKIISKKEDEIQELKDALQIKQEDYERLADDYNAALNK